MFRVCIAAMLGVATLALSGCAPWATIADRGADGRSITVKAEVSSILIIDCTADNGTGLPDDETHLYRDLCVIDTIENLCRGIPVPGISAHDCDLIGSLSPGWEDDFRLAVQGVIGSSECLTYAEYPDRHSNFWGSVDLGHAGCQ